MAKKTSAVNPFYVLLVLAGIAFSLTACAYGVMTLRAVRGAGPVDLPASAGERLLVFLDAHGAWLMAAELATLGLATFGAIATDQYWMRRAARLSPPGDAPVAEPKSPVRSPD